MTRDEIVEVMARALAAHDGRDPDAAGTWFGGNKIWVEYESDAKAALSALEAVGMRVVPAEPTDKMLRAARWALDRARERDLKVQDPRAYTADEKHAHRYRAMLAASQEDGETRDA